MAMDMNQWNELTRNMLAATEDQAAMTSLLNQATNEYSELFAEHARFEQEKDKLKKDNEALRKANMEFFLQLTEQKKETEPGLNKDDKPDAEKITIQDLFKEGD